MAKTVARSRVTDRGIGFRFQAGTDTFYLLSSVHFEREDQTASHLTVCRR